MSLGTEQLPASALNIRDDGHEVAVCGANTHRAGRIHCFKTWIMSEMCICIYSHVCIHICLYIYIYIYTYVCVPVGPLISFHPMLHYGSKRRSYARRLGKPFATLVVLRGRRANVQHSDLISNPKRKASVAAGCVRDSVTTRSVLCNVCMYVCLLYVVCMCM